MNLVQNLINGNKKSIFQIDNSLKLGEKKE